jgi:hypothetical protein
VHSVCEYYDGPRSGFADYRGQLHHFTSEGLDVTEECEDFFVLTPIDTEILPLVLESEQIWRDWEAAFHRGEAPESTHPGLPGQNARFAELDAILKNKVAGSSLVTERVRATFRAQPGQDGLPPGIIRKLEVEWSEFD